MEVIKPSWVKHHDDKNRRQCIFSCDIDLEGTRCATGGMDGVIRIWRVSGLFESLEEQKGTNLLASMSRHNGSVLCVRWSSNGMLASSSDDTIILIWQLDSRPASMRGNLEGLNDEGEVVESYKVVKRLIGHQSDTVGVEWSPDGKVLASCSLDGTICFWNSDPSSSQTLIGKIERAHSGFIKGLSWDPAGKFLASQSDDSSCIVWNVESMLSSQGSSTAFVLDSNDAEMFKETVLEKIFVNMSKMTFFHRPGWSPDGTLLALANATNRQLPVVALVERNNWQGPGTFFVGHLGPVEAVRFNPRLFTSSKNSSTDLKEMICAVASQDGQVSIWSSSRTGPLLVLQELFEHSVMDLAWTPDGMVLVAVSYDGAAVAIRLNPAEFDLKALNDSEQAEHLKNAFGNISSASGDSAQGYIESVKVIECLRENEQFLSNHPKSPEAKEPKAPETTETFTTQPIIQPPTSTPMPPSVPVITNYNAQTEQVVNGKKRITPQLLMTSGPTTTSVNNTSFSSQSQSQNLRSMGLVRLRDEDFLIHRKLLERASGSLLNCSRSINKDLSTTSVVFESPEIDCTNISVPLTNVQIFSVSIEITNNISGTAASKSSALIQFIQNSQIVWKERVRGTIYQSSGTRKYSAYAIKQQQHSILVLTASGRRYLPPISLDSRSVYLKINPKTNNLISVTQNGTISIWDLKNCKQIFSDSSIVNSLKDVPVRLIDFDEMKFEITTNSSVLIYNKSLGIWTVGKVELSETAITTVSPTDRAERIEKLKAKLLQNNLPEVNERQISELEFELSLIFVNLRNGKPLNPSEEAHFQRILATYALKLVKENRALKAKELVEDLRELNCEELVENLLKPLFASHSISISSTWQDLITQSL